MSERKLGDFAVLASMLSFNTNVTFAFNFDMTGIVLKIGAPIRILAEGDNPLIGEE